MGLPNAALPDARFRSLDHVHVGIPPGGEDDARTFHAGVLGPAEAG